MISLELNLLIFYKNKILSKKCLKDKDNLI